jgi:Aldo/keto reductase family
VAYILQKAPYVFPIVGARTVEHVKSYNDALRVELSKEDMDAIDTAIPFNPPFPVNFLYLFGGDRKYDLTLTGSDVYHNRMGTQFDSPSHPLVSFH